jgi:hypothetical protein
MVAPERAASGSDLRSSAISSSARGLNSIVEPYTTRTRLFSLAEVIPVFVMQEAAAAIGRSNADKRPLGRQ